MAATEDVQIRLMAEDLTKRAFQGMNVGAEEVRKHMADIAKNISEAWKQSGLTLQEFSNRHLPNMMRNAIQMRSVLAQTVGTMLAAKRGTQDLAGAVTAASTAMAGTGGSGTGGSAGGALAAGARLVRMGGMALTAAGGLRELRQAMRAAAEEEEKMVRFQNRMAMSNRELQKSTDEMIRSRARTGIGADDLRKIQERMVSAGLSTEEMGKNYARAATAAKAFG